MHGALIGSTIAKKARGNPVGNFFHLNGEGSSAGDGPIGAQNTVGTQNTIVKVADVHGAALSVVGSRLPGQNLRHHRTDIHTLSDGLAVATVGRQHVVLFLQGRRRADARGLLSCTSPCPNSQKAVSSNLLTTIIRSINVRQKSLSFQ